MNCAGRLIQEALDSSDNTLDQTESYIYDLVSNRLQKTTDRSGTANDTTFKYTYDNNDRLTGETRHADLTGTATANQTTTYTWNGTQQASKAVVTTSVSTVTQSMVYGLTGQLAQVTTETKNSGGTVTARTRVDYRYDTSGIRFIAIDSTDSNLATTTYDSAAAGRTEYLIDHANMTGYGQTIIETKYNASNQATERTSYTFGTDEITQTVSTINPSTGAVTGTPVTSVFSHDGHGSVRALLGASAALSQVFIYSAYGEMLGIYSTAGVKQAVPATGGYESIAQTRLLYNGEGIDSRTGLYNFRARWYSASNARFERLDPFAGNPNDPFSFNKYGFVHGNPIMGTDPSGLLWGFSLYAGMIGATMGAVSGAITGGVDAYLGDEDWVSGAIWGAAIGGAIGFVTGGFSAAATTAIQALSSTTKLRIVAGMAAANALSLGWGLATAKTLSQGIFRGGLSLFGLLATAQMARQQLRYAATSQFSSSLNKAELLRYADAFDIFFDKLDEAVGVAASFLQPSVRQNGRHILGDKSVVEFLYGGKKPPGTKDVEALLEGFQGYRVVEVKYQKFVDVALGKFRDTKRALDAKGLNVEAFEMSVQKGSKFNDANYSIGPDGRLLWSGAPQDIDGIPIMVVEWGF